MPEAPQIRKSFIAKYHGLDVLSVVIEQFARERNPLTFVQVGANDGITDDDLRPLIIKHKMSGVFVEPNPDAFARLRYNYRDAEGVFFENAAVADTTGEITLYVHDASHGVPESSDVFASTKRELVDRIRYPDTQHRIKEIAAKAITYSELLRKYNLNSVDLLYIDTEGLDDAVLEMVSLEPPSPSIIHFEHLHMNDDCLRIQLGRLGAAGYQMVQLPWDILAVKIADNT